MPVFTTILETDTEGDVATVCQVFVFLFFLFFQSSFQKTHVFSVLASGFVFSSVSVRLLRYYLSGDTYRLGE